MKYFESKAAGWIGVAIMLIGLVTALAPGIIPFIPLANQSAFSAIIVMLGGVKTWLALNPFSQIVQSPALVALNVRNVTVAPVGDIKSPNTTTLADPPGPSVVLKLKQQ